MPRLFFYVQHLLGIGHLRRAYLIADACQHVGIDVTLILGGEHVKGLPLPDNIRVIQLAPIKAKDPQFSGLVTASGAELTPAYWQERALQLTRLAEEKPDMVMVEMFPFGRRQLRHELSHWLDLLSQQRKRPLIISSIRDILVRKADPKLAEKREQQMTGWFKRWFDYALVHGDPRLIELEQTFPAAKALADQLYYTGLVAPPPIEQAPGRSGITISCGGGAVGYKLLQVAIEAYRINNLDQPWQLYTGPNLPQAEFKALSQQGDNNLSIARFCNNFPLQLSRSSLSISQAGYNTVADLLATHTPAVLIPFAEAGETEQTHRAEQLQKLGLASMVKEQDLTPISLLQALKQARTQSSTIQLQLDGAEQSAMQLLQWHANRRDSRHD